MEKLVNYFAQMGFERDNLKRIVDSFVLQTFEKNDFVVEYGKTSKHIGFINNGMFQYYVLKDGEERTHYINIENTWFASLLSFISETPSQENVRALTNGSIYLISKPNLKKLVNEIPGFNTFYISLLEQSICGIEASRFDLIVLTAEERYLKMLTSDPELYSKSHYNTWHRCLA